MNFVPLFFALLVEPTRPFVLDILVLEPVALRVLGDKVLHNRVIQHILQSVSFITSNIYCISRNLSNTDVRNYSINLP